MSQRRFCSRSALVVGALFCLLVPSSAVAAGTPAAVTVRVEGLTETKIPPTLVTTTTTPVVKDDNPEDSCPGTSAAGALELATKGAWSGKWFTGLGYTVETIENESYPFTQPYFWTFWLNHKSQEVGVCGAELEPGDEVLLFPECFSETVGECPSAPTPLAIEAPPTANAGENVTVTVKQYNTQGEASPVGGANVGGGGTGAITDSQGHATLKFFGDGTYTLHVSGAESTPAVRTETTICVHEGNDGTCGTTSPTKAPGQAPGSSMAPGTETGQNALVADAGSVHDGHVYSRRHAPRVLSGKVISKTPVTSISIRLRRTYKGHCWAYNGAQERLQRVRCSRGSFFKVSSGGSSFSYLLPSKLPPGRYVYEIEATNSAGSHSSQHRGVSKIVFYVK